MERDEIIKALECHIKRRCYDCPIGKEDIQTLNRPCSTMIAENALALIKELIEEAANWRIDAENFRNERDELVEENERLKAEKSAALDTFAEKLKRYYNALDGRTPAVLVAYHIDQIKEEMLKTDKKCD